MAGGKREKFDNPVVDWIDERLPIFTIMQKEYGTFPTPKNFNYFWNFGAIAMVMLVTMILTGVVLAMQYTAHADYAFDSVQRIMRDVNYGWLLRYLHMNGASFFFIAVYIHIFRGMYYGSYKKPRELLWILGVTIFLLMMATAFLGYTLPWSQMGGWGATVITNLFSAIPLVGDSIVELLWGGFSVDNPTLKRFFALHYLLPFVICAVVFLHVWALHVTGSNNPLGIEPKSNKDTLPFHPYYTIKDSFGLLVFFVFYAGITFYAPMLFAHPDHFLEYNPLQTPAHIVPEWYFLPFYAILRAITFDLNVFLVLGGLLGAYLVWHHIWTKKKPVLPVAMSFLIHAFAALFLFIGFVIAFLSETGLDVINAFIARVPLSDMIIIEAKLGGVLAMFGSILVLFFLPFIDTHPVRSARFRPWFRIAMLALAVNFFILMYAGAKPAEGLWVLVAQLTTAYHFAFFLVLLPFFNRFEKVGDLPKSINEAVLAEKKTSHK